MRASIAFSTVHMQRAAQHSAQR